MEDVSEMSQLAQELFKSCPSVFDKDRGACHRLECDKGWFSHIEKASRKLEEINRQIPLEAQRVVAAQIKQKFGGLRYYYHLPDGFPKELVSQVRDVMNEAHTACDTTCEWCSKPGKLDQSKGWLLCLCEECTEKRK